MLRLQMGKKGRFAADDPKAVAQPRKQKLLLRTFSGPPRMFAASVAPHLQNAPHTVEMGSLGRQQRLVIPTRRTPAWIDDGNDPNVVRCQGGSNSFTLDRGENSG